MIQQLLIGSAILQRIDSALKYRVRLVQDRTSAFQSGAGCCEKFNRRKEESIAILLLSRQMSLYHQCNPSKPLQTQRPLNLCVQIPRRVSYREKRSIVILRKASKGDECCGEGFRWPRDSLGRERNTVWVIRVLYFVALSGAMIVRITGKKIRSHRLQPRLRLRLFIKVKYSVFLTRGVPEFSYPGTGSLIAWMKVPTDMASSHHIAPYSRHKADNNFSASLEDSKTRIKVTYEFRGL